MTELYPRCKVCNAFVVDGNCYAIGGFIHVECFDAQHSQAASSDKPKRRRPVPVGPEGTA